MILRNITTLVVLLGLSWSASCAPRAQRRILQGPQKHMLTGTAILLDVGYPQGSSELSGSMLAVRKENGQRVQVVVQEERKLADLRTGTQVEVTGEWRARPNRPNGSGNDNGSGNGSGGSSGNENAQGTSFVFHADAIKDVGPALVPQPLIERPYVEDEQALPTHEWDRELAAATAAAGGSRRRLHQTSFTTISMQLLKSSMKVLVIPIIANQPNGASCPGTGRNLISVADVRRTVFEEHAPQSATVGGFFNQCSHNKTTLTTSSSLVVNMVVLPCSGTSKYGTRWEAGRCEFDDFDSMSDAADQVLLSRGVNIFRFEHRVYLLPPNPCGWVGLAYVGCDGTFECRSWVTGGFWGSAQVMSHELGHNLYMEHAGSLSLSGALDPYGDNTCPMGYCCSQRCLNAPHAWQMGWTSLRQLTGAQLPPATTVNTTLTIQSLSPDLSGIRVVTNWAAGTQPLFISYRYHVGGDEHMPYYGFANRVHLYSSAIIHNRDYKRTSLRASLAIGESWTLPPADLVIRRLASTEYSLAVITICRKGGPGETVLTCANNVDNNCDGLSGAADPLCEAYSA